MLKLIYSLLAVFLAIGNIAYAAPTVTSINPISGPVAGGTVVTLTGTGFTGATAVDFGSRPAASFLVVNDTTITAITPVGTPGASSVTVTTGSGTSPATHFNLFTFQGDWIAYILGPGNTVTPVNLATTVVGTSIPLTGSPSAMAITPDGVTGYATNDTVTTPLTLATNTAGADISVPAGPRGVAITPDGVTAYVVSNAISSVTPITVATNTAGASVPLGTNITGIAITPDQTRAYITDTEADVVYQLNLPTITPVGATLPGFSSPTFLEITPDGTKAYVITLGSGIGPGSVTPIIIATNTVGTPITVGNNPIAIAITPDGKSVYIANGDAPFSVSVIDIASDTVIATIPLTSAPTGIESAPDAKTVYVSTSASTIFVIDTATNTLLAPIAFPAGTTRGIVISPDEAPVAEFQASTAPSGSATIFDASASLSPVGTIANYAWDFGDGTTASTSNPVIAHVYAMPGNYTVTLIVTNSAGTSTTQVFTGQTMNRNGGPPAILSQTITISSSAPLPPSNFRGEVIENKFLTFDEFDNHLTWDPSPDPIVLGYRLFRNGKLIAIIGASGPFHFDDFKAPRRKKVTYTLVAFNTAGQQSIPLTVILNDKKD